MPEKVRGIGKVPGPLLGLAARELFSREKYDVLRLPVDSGRTPMSAAQVASFISNIFKKLSDWQLTFKKI